ncbi:Alpha/Beta hydrolase protein [Fomitopsis serialis]|uniref:Alpha/Beta hydrolase protein n=1 Tax=Fomitopsis serialis TaxID=139415 RepID=UPI002007B955|nr:Alpha/Beta hydrolase protein [Neoantrodia serialis]KAH9911586.1 Alpha/Beta hydrolase protein [Neoantrodia serialis]
MLPLSSQAFVCDPRPDYPLLVTAKRYSLPGYTCEDPDALTLILTHGTGYHKEQWEPTLEHLFESLAPSRAGEASPVKIRDVWAIDCPNHGDSAVLNEHTLLWGYDNVLSWEEYARAVHIFLSGLGRGVDVDFSKRKLVGIGHSMGCIALYVFTTLQRTTQDHRKHLLPETQLRVLHLRRADVLPQGSMPPSFSTLLTTGAEKRRDIFASREEALSGPRAARPPDGCYPDKTAGVTLNAQGTGGACYRDHSNTGRVRAFNYLPTLCAARPVHVVFGAIDDYMYNKQASARRVPGAGHLIVQTQPRGLADAIWAILTKPGVEKTSREAISGLAQPFI